MHANKFSIGWLKRGTLSGIVKWGYKDNLSLLIIFFKEKISCAQKHTPHLEVYVPKKIVAFVV